MIFWKDINAQSPEDAFRWAIVGYGKVAVAHTEGIMRARHRLVGFSTSNERVRNGNATDLVFNIGPTKGQLFDTRKMITAPDWESLLSQVRGKAEGVIVCCPTQHHVAVAKAVALAGMHCFLEKPMAGSARDARELHWFYRDRPQKLVIGHVLPAFPEFAALRQTILKKGIQNVTSLVMRRYAPWAETDDEDGNRAKGGAAGDLIDDLQLLASVGAIKSAQIIDFQKRGDLMQSLHVSLELQGAQVPVYVTGRAGQSHEGAHHSYQASFSDGTAIIFNGKTVRGFDGVVEPRSVGQIFGEKLGIAASYFRGGRMNASYLEPEMSLSALEVLDEAEVSTQ